MLITKWNYKMNSNIKPKLPYFARMFRCCRSRNLFCTRSCRKNILCWCHWFGKQHHLCKHLSKKSQTPFYEKRLDPTTKPDFPERRRFRLSGWVSRTESVRSCTDSSIDFWIRPKKIYTLSVKK